MKYREICDEQPVMNNCFFAFSNKQIHEGLDRFGLTINQIVSADMGLYGTIEGIKEFFKFYDNQAEKISKECDPQEVYDYEFNNHECSYTCDDEEVIKIIIGYFGLEKAKQVKRKFGYYKIQENEKEN